MKILFFTGTHFADCSFPLIRAFKEIGHEVTTIMQLTPDRCHKTIIDINSQPLDANVIPASRFEELAPYKLYVNLDDVYFANHPMSLSSLKSLTLALKVRNFISKGNFDVILYDSAFQFWGMIQYAINSKWIYMVHDPLPHIGADTFWYKFHKRIALSRASKYVLFNQSQSKDFCKKYKIKEKDVFFNKLSIYDVYNTLKPSEQNDCELEVLFFGRIDKYKGIEYLCKAIRKVVQEIPSVHLTIAGKGDFSFDINDYKDLKCVSFENRYISNEEMATLFNKAAIVVCPYIEATQSGVIMTAYAFGKPVIASRVGGLPEMVEDKVTGLLVPPKDEKALADAILLILKDNELLNNFVTNINNLYRNGSLSWRAIAEKYIKIMQS